MAEPPLHAHSPGMSAVIERNINALLAHRAAEERKRGLQEKIAEVVTRFAGSMLFVYLHLILFSGWILASVGWVPLLPRVDPSLVKLAMFASVEAIFLSTFVLITQNRMSANAEKRAGERFGQASRRGAAGGSGALGSEAECCTRMRAGSHRRSVAGRKC